ncbi:vesicle transport protein USE1 [Condylostylus longicornis]|uniref:vesicle transport protein USE1 n=1 Tax=Condylostylus longicornis TaxID=2530218 RepID=UPI00244D9E37|nr:vesicle transport protein USE1 [Condylostylus longicornis]
MLAKLEVDIRILLTNCEELSKDESNFWRLKKFIKSLDTMIYELKDTETYSSLSSLSDYYNRLQELKTITNYQEASENKKILSKSKLKQGASNDLIREVNQIKSSKKLSDLRKELLDEDDGLRKRTNLQNEGMDQTMKYYSNVQEKITEDMLALTRSLREQTATANQIIKKDTETISQSSHISDKNYDSLAKESEILQHHSSRACNCWKWLMIVSVIIIFIFMVLFMRIMKKKTS